MKIERLMHTFTDGDKIFDPQPGVKYHVATRVSDVYEKDNELCIETTLSNLQKATIRISIVDDFAINLKYSQKKFPQGKFKEHIEAKNITMPKYKVIKKKTNVLDSAEVKGTFIAEGTGSVGREILVEQIVIPFKKNSKEFVITKNPLNIEIIDKKTKDVQFTLNWRDGFSYFGGFSAPGLGFKQVADDLWLPFMSWSIKNDELTYGLGEKFGPLEKTNTRKTIWNSDTSGKSNTDLAYCAIPYVVTTKNFGLLLDTGSKSYFDIGSSVTDASSLMNTEENLDIYLFAGSSMKEVTNDYTKLTGKINGVPDKSYGVWYSKLYYHDKNAAQNVINLAAKNELPIDVIHIDPKWLRDRYSKSCNFEEATERFGDFKEFFISMSKQEVDISFWINPYIQGDQGSFYKEAVKNNYLVKSLEGGNAHPYTGVEVYQPNNYLVDLTNPEAYKWWKEHITSLAKKGLKYVVNDYGDGVPKEALFYNGLTGLEMRQYYTFLYNQVVWEGLAEVYGKENVAKIARPGYIGSHKFPGKWGGDSYSRWSELKNSIQAGLSHSFTGEVLWGTDIGGFISTPEDELYIRWMQLGSFTPYTRMHGISNREPWHFSKNAVSISKTYLELKRQWLPMWKIGELEAVKTGLTSMRSLAIEFQGDKIAGRVDDQFMITDNVMISPVIDRGATSRDIYFPKGKWTNYWKRTETIKGRTYKNILAPLDQLPIFIKEGTIITNFSNGKYNFSTIKNETLVVEIYGKESSKGKKEFMINNKKVVITYAWEAGKPTTKSVVVKGWDKVKVKVITK